MLRFPETDHERALLLREALKHMSAAKIARYFRPYYSPGKTWNAQRVRLHAKTGGYDDWRVEHLQRIVAEGRARVLKKSKGGADLRRRACLKENGVVSR